MFRACLPAALMLAVLAPARAAPVCPPPGTYVPQKTVTFSTWMAEPVYSGAESRARITVLSGLRSADPHQFTTGLTRTNTELSLNLQTWQVDMGQGTRCVGLARVEATWKINEIKVDIASEYLPGSCQYRVIRTHEDEHVFISRDTFRHWAPNAEAVLRDAAARLAPRPTNAAAASVAEEFRKSLAAALQPTFTAFRAELKDRNAAIDTPGNYRRVNGQCPSW